MDDAQALDALCAAVLVLRVEHVKCDRHGCPWHLMWEYDVKELFLALRVAGFTLKEVASDED